MSEVDAITFTCRGPKPLRGADRTAVNCGQILNVLIAAVPEDSQDHEIVCPKCKTKISVMRTKAEAASED